MDSKYIQTCSLYPKSQLGADIDRMKFIHPRLSLAKNGSSFGNKMGLHAGWVKESSTRRPRSLQHSIPLSLPLNELLILKM